MPPPLHQLVPSHQIRTPSPVSMRNSRHRLMRELEHLNAEEKKLTQQDAPISLLKRAIEPTKHRLAAVESTLKGALDRTFEQLNATQVALLREFVTSSGVRLAPDSSRRSEDLGCSHTIPCWYRTANTALNLRTIWSRQLRCEDVRGRITSRWSRRPGTIAGAPRLSADVRAQGASMADPAQPTTLSVAVVQLIGQLAWPSVLLVVVWKFRHRIHDLLSRIASVKVGGSEWVFQEPVAKPPTAEGTTKVPVVVGPDGFLTMESLRASVQESGLLDTGNAILKELLIFQTPRQRTWLLASKSYVYVLLDDDRTQAKMRSRSDVF